MKLKVNFEQLKQDFNTDDIGLGPETADLVWINHMGEVRTEGLQKLLEGGLEIVTTKGHQFLFRKRIYSSPDAHNLVSDSVYLTVDFKGFIG